MPLKLNIGLNKKVGEANYGSRGASVNLEIELDSQLVNDSGKLHERIRQCFGLVRTSLDEELNGGNANGGNGHAPPPANGNQGAKALTATNGNAQAAGGFNGRRGGDRPATQSQVKAIHAIARRHRINLVTILQERYQVNKPDDLTLQQASLVIDELKAAETSNGS